MRDRHIGDRLFATAVVQQGFFTARQAREAGYSDSHITYHVRKGRWIRVARGIYRLANFPPGERPDLVQWHLWSCDRAGKPQGVFSHETALAIHDLSDVMPAKYHLTVPRTFRRSRPFPREIVLHFQDLSKGDIWEMEGYRLTSPLRTIRDALESDVIFDELVVQAMCEGLDRGCVLLSELEEMASGFGSIRARRLLNEAKKKR